MDMMSADPFKLIESVEAETDAAMRQQALCSAIDLLAAIESPPAEVSYALGYAWYLMPGESSERDQQIPLHLNEALRLQPDHAYARLYLAHFHYDAARFELALPLLLELEKDQFSRVGQAWRDAKAAELLLSCLLELRDEARIPDALECFLERVQAVEDCVLPVPQELVKSLLKLVRS